jgi:hypothetical protein
MPQVDHLIEPGAEEVLGGGASKHRKTPRKRRIRHQIWGKLYSQTDNNTRKIMRL